MREILFRGKAINRDPDMKYRTDYKNGDWVYGLISVPFNESFPGLPAEMVNTNGISGIEVDYKTIGQYTGLTDKNGKKIFEGDICKTCFESYTRNWEEVGVVTEFRGAYGIESADGKHFLAFINETVYARSCEVIGNIHDNPEFLEDKE